jgi:chemotaxis signal transduction protein
VSTTRATWHKSQNKRRSEPVILFAIGDNSFAISANAVEEIRNLTGLAPCRAGFAFPSLGKIKFTLERNAKMYLVVDSNFHFRMLPSNSTRLLVLRHAPVAVLVDRIDRMMEIAVVHRLPKAFVGKERNWYRGLAVIQDQIVPLVKPESFLTKAESAIAQREVANIGEGEKPGKLPLRIGAVSV